MLQNKTHSFALVLFLSLILAMFTNQIYAKENTSTDEIVEKEAVYLGVENYGQLEKNEDESSLKNFHHKFFIDGKVVNLKIDSEDLLESGLPKFDIQNKLWEGYIYKIKIDNDKVVDAKAIDENNSEYIAGTISNVNSKEITVDGKNIPLSEETKVYKISWLPGGSEVAEKTTEEAINSQAKISLDKDGNVKNIYITFLAKDYKAPVSYTPGEKTLKNFLKAATQPVGTTLYIYGGTWDWQDDGSSINSRSIGIAQSWIDFFQYQDDKYTYSLDEENNAKDYYPNGSWNQYYYAGIDCSGYVGWAIYNTLNTKDGNEGYVMSATKMAKNFADRGWGTYTQDISIPKNVEDSDFKPGDIFSMNGHVWICLGTCSDGSIVIMHSTPSDSITGNPGGGAQISAVGYDKDCEAYKLADHYMTTYYPEWSKKYPTALKNIEDYTSFKKDSDAGKFSWKLDKAVLTDPDNLRDKSAEEVLKVIYGEGQTSDETVFTIDKDMYKQVTNGESKMIKMDIAPFIKEDKTYLPMRYLAEAIGAKVDWNEETRTASFTRNDETISIQIDSNKVLLADGQETELENKLEIQKGRIVLPLTNISKLFKLTNGNIDDGISQNIEWDGNARTVTVKVD